MIPVLYEKSEWDFTHNGIGFLADAVKASVTEERNGSFELTLQYPTEGMWFDKIKSGSIIKAKTNETSEPQLFRIYKISKPLQGVVTYSAEHISYDLNGIYTLGLNLSSVTAGEAMASAVNGAVTDCPYTVFSDISERRQVVTDNPVSVRSALGTVRDSYGGEFEFDNFTVKLHKARGQDNGVTIAYGKNLTDLKQEDSISECYTHILPFAAYQREPEEYDENAEPETVYVYLSEKVVQIPGAENLGHARVFPVNFSDRFEEGAAYTEAALRELAKDYLSDTDLGVPKISLSVSFVQLWQTEEYKNIAPLERVRLCDIVTVKFPGLGVESKSKVVKTVFDVLSEHYESIDLGDVKETLADAVIGTEKALKTVKKATDRLESHIKRTDERITLEVLHITEDQKELYSRIELTEESITAEVARASEEEGKLSSRIVQTAESISAEVTRATGAEAELSGKIELTAASLTTSFEKKVSEESDRATKAEKELSSTITQTAESLTSTFTAKITETDETLTGKINDEAARADKVEKELSSTITQTAESMTSTFTAKITAETERAEEKEEELSSTISQTAESISAEVTRATGAETELSGKIELTADSLTSEIKRATEEEGALSSRITQTANSISSEITRAKDAESNLSTTLTSKITQTVNAIRLSVSSKTSGDETESTISITNGSTTLNSVKVIGTTAKQAASIVADAVGGITLSHTSTTADDQTTSTLTLKSGTATLGSAKIIGTTAEQAAKITADAIKGITLTVSNSTTGASSTLTIKSGSTTLSSAKIEFTGLVTFSNLKDGKTEISGDNITTGKISANRIDVDSLYVTKVYASTGSGTPKTVICASGSSSSANVYLGGNTSGGVVNNSVILGSQHIAFGTRYYYTYGSPLADGMLIFDTINRVIYPYNNNYSWRLGSSNYPFYEIHTLTAYLGTSSSSSKIGFFGVTPQSRKSVSAASTSSSVTAADVAKSLNSLITALEGYGLIS